MVTASRPSLAKTSSAVFTTSSCESAGFAARRRGARRHGGGGTVTRTLYLTRTAFVARTVFVKRTTCVRGSDDHCRSRCPCRPRPAHPGLERRRRDRLRASLHRGPGLRDVLRAEHARARADRKLAPRPVRRTAEGLEADRARDAGQGAVRPPGRRRRRRG